MGPRL